MKKQSSKPYLLAENKDLVLVVLEVLSPLLHLLGEVGLELGGLLRVVDLQVEVDAGGGKH